MDKTGVSAALQALARSDDKRPEAARLRDVFDDVEAALAAGVSRADVLAALHDQGFTMTLRTFDSALYRIRKERAGDSKRVPRRDGANATPAPRPGVASDPETDAPAPSGATDSAHHGAESNDGQAGEAAP